MARVLQKLAEMLQQVDQFSESYKRLPNFFNRLLIHSGLSKIFFGHFLGSIVEAGKIWLFYAHYAIVLKRCLRTDWQVSFACKVSRLIKSLWFLSMGDPKKIKCIQIFPTKRMNLSTASVKQLQLSRPVTSNKCQIILSRDLKFV
jgi:hypothetical protein